ncbi:MAG: hypothetical protein JW881_10925 [Spirochaetales bacterium]|nr:hypothetical protein [Spirochaetales bacterium]
MKRRVVLFLCVLAGYSVCAIADNVAEFDLVFRRMAEKLTAVESRLPEKTVAVYGFDVIGRPGDSYAVYATEKLTHELVNTGSLLVIERSRISEVLEEQSFSLSGMVDAGTAARIGKILSVDAVIIGSILVTESRTEFIVRVVESDRGIILCSVDDHVTVTITAGEENPDDGSNGTHDGPAITVPKKTYQKSEKITVGFTGLPGNKTDWITLVKASEPDDTYAQWSYTDGKEDGSVTFNGVVPGEYEIRLYFDWPAGGYVVQKRLTITVQ